MVLNSHLKNFPLVLILLIVGCDRKPASREFDDHERSEILSHFQMVKIGMSRDEADSILGESLSELDRGEDGMAVYYWETAERMLEPSESPFMASGIMLMFQNGLVSEKAFNHQWVNRHQLEIFLEGMKKGEPY